VRAVDLPLDAERELVRDHERTYAFNGTDSRVLTTVGVSRRAGIGSRTHIRLAERLARA